MAEITYRTGLTPKAWALALAPIAVGGFLIWMGMGELDRYWVKDPMRFVFGYGPMVMGLGLILAAMWTGLRNMGSEIRLNGRGVKCLDRSKEILDVGWEHLTFYCSKRGAFKVLVLADGRRHVQMVDLFVPGFERLQSELDKQRRAVKARTRHKLD